MPPTSGLSLNLVDPDLMQKHHQSLNKLADAVYVWAITRAKGRKVVPMRPTKKAQARDQTFE